MDNVFLYADNDRVTDIFTTYNVSMKEALEHDKRYFLIILSALSFVHLIVTQFEYLGNIISIIVETSSFLDRNQFKGQDEGSARF
jgi:hypothetical protein